MERCVGNADRGGAGGTQVSVDSESGQTIISGMGELHLDIYIERLRREYKVASHQLSTPWSLFRAPFFYLRACRPLGLMACIIFVSFPSTIGTCLFLPDDDLCFWRVVFSFS